MFIQGYLHATTKKRVQNMSDEAGMTNDESMTKPPNDKKPAPIGCHFRLRHQAFLRHSSLGFRHLSFSALTSGNVSDSIERVKWLALFALLILECSCTTLANRRDLYSPQPDPDLSWQREVPATSHAEPASR